MKNLTFGILAFLSGIFCVFALAGWLVFGFNFLEVALVLPIIILILFSLTQTTQTRKVIFWSLGVAIIAGITVLSFGPKINLF